MRWPWPSPRLPKTLPTPTLWPSIRTPLPSTTTPRPRLQLSTKRPRPSTLLPRWRSKATTARSRSRRSPSPITRLLSKSKSPTPPMVLGACGSRVLVLSLAMPLRQPTSPRGSSRSSWTASSQVLAPLSASFRRWSSSSCSLASWSCAATCPASRSSWTASSASSACLANPSSRCSSPPAAACPPSWQPRRSRTRRIAA